MFGLLLHGLGDNSAWNSAVLRHDERQRVTLAALGSLTVRSGARSAAERGLTAADEAKVVPIRFPPRLYDELKAWCEEHNFPMAAVVRGLVERFLESQGRP